MTTKTAGAAEPAERTNDWVVVCLTDHGRIVKVVGPFDDSSAAHDWRDDHWPDRVEIRKVLSR